MTPDDLIQLMRLSATSKVRAEVERAYKTDQIFYEKLVNLFLRAKRSDTSEAWPPAP